jgi:hypothetical protein
MLLVSSEGGQNISTSVKPTLPNGLRGAAIAIYGLRGHGPPPIRPRCPAVVALDESGRAIKHYSDRTSIPLERTLGDTQLWDAAPEPAFESCAVRIRDLSIACHLPTTPPPGICEFTILRLPAQTGALRGAVVTRIIGYQNIVGHSLLSCVDITFSFKGESAFESAILLDAAKPGSDPPALPGMQPLAGHHGVFVTLGENGEIVARRIRGAWLVVEEDGYGGRRVPLELLYDLQTKIELWKSSADFHSAQ